MIYLDSGATSLHKPPEVMQAVMHALDACGNAGRGGHEAAREADKIAFNTRMEAAKLFDCRPEQAAFTFNCTHGLNIAIHTLVKQGAKVIVSGFEHNAVMRPLYARKARIAIAGRELFNWDNILTDFEKALKAGADCAVFTAVSNVYGYILPYEELSAMCRREGVPFIIDGAQAAGSLPLELSRLGADFIAVPGHKGLLGPQGTGLLLCGRTPEPLLFGGTGSQSEMPSMPESCPERIEPGTLNLPGIAGLGAALGFLNRTGVQTHFEQEHDLLLACVQGLKKRGIRVIAGSHQAATVSIVTAGDCEETAQELAKFGIFLRAGLHCAPLAHESGKTLKTGTLRASFGYGNTYADVTEFIQTLAKLEHRNF